jgi:hypothetical protein
LTASTNIPASTFVVDNGDGTCSIADPNNVAHMGRVTGLVATATTAGSLAVYQASGSAADVSGTFSATDSTLWIGDGTSGRLGSIVNVAPAASTAAWRQPVGSPTSASKIVLLLAPPYALPRSSVTLIASSGGYLIPTSAARSAITQGDASGLTVALNGLAPTLPSAIAAAGQKIFGIAGALQLTTPAGSGAGTQNKYWYGGYIVPADQVSQIGSPDGVIGSKVVGFNILHNFGGSGARGGRHAGEFNTVHTAPTASDNPDRNYVGAQGQVISIAGDGGTSASDLRGQYFGLSASTIIQSGAKWVYNATGEELNLVLLAGSSVGIACSQQLVDTLQTRGMLVDAFQVWSCAAGSTTTHRAGIFAGGSNGAPALGSDSDFAYIASGAIPTISTFLNAPGVHFLDSIIRTDYTILGEGVLQLAKANAVLSLGSASSASTPAINLSSSGNGIVDAQIIASGGGTSANQGNLTFAAGMLLVPTARPGAQYGSNLGAPGYEFGVGYLRDLVLRPSPSLAPGAPGQLTITSPTNTTLRFQFMGADSVVRSATLTLS